MTNTKPTKNTNKTIIEEALPITPVKRKSSNSLTFPPKRNNSTLYGVFNTLPTDKTISDIPESDRWLYDSPLLIDYSYDYAKGRSDSFNKERNTPERRDKPYLIQTPTVVLVCDVTFSRWRTSNQDQQGQIPNN